MPADDFTLARRRKIIEAFRKAAKDLIELDAVPFAEFRTDVVADGRTVTVVLKIEDCVAES